MNDLSAPRTRERCWPRGLLGMLVLVVSVEGTLARHALDLTRFYIHDWAVGGRAASDEAASARVLCLGDSLVKFGLHPEVLEARLGVPCYNLAVCDGQAPSSYFLLRRALEAGARPDAVVVDFVPHLLATGPRHNLRQWPELLSAREALDLALHGRHAAMAASIGLGCLLPSVKDRFEIRVAVRSALRGEPSSRRREVLDHVRQWRRHRGAEPSPARPEFGGEVDTANPAYFPRAWSCDPVNDAYVRRFLDLAAAHGIAVYWLLPPVVPRFQARRDALGLEDSYARFLDRVRARYPGLVVVDARRIGFDPSRFIDPLHLNREGARALTLDVAEVVARRREEGRDWDWVALCPGEPRPAPLSEEVQGGTSGATAAIVKGQPGGMPMRVGEYADAGEASRRPGPGQLGLAVPTRGAR